MLKKVKGFLIQSTAKVLSVDPEHGGKVAQSQLVLVKNSLPKAIEEAIAQCPSNMEIIALSVTELPVWIEEDSAGVTKEHGLRLN
jgi:hypothetical protein